MRNLHRLLQNEANKNALEDEPGCAKLIINTDSVPMTTSRGMGQNPIALEEKAIKYVQAELGIFIL